jgi:hypothetical protein
MIIFKELKGRNKDILIYIISFIIYYIALLSPFQKASVSDEEPIYSEICYSYEQNAYSYQYRFSGIDNFYFLFIEEFND